MFSGFYFNTFSLSLSLKLYSENAFPLHYKSTQHEKYLSFKLILVGFWLRVYCIWCCIRCQSWNFCFYLSNFYFSPTIKLISYQQPFVWSSLLYFDLDFLGLEKVSMYFKSALSSKSVLRLRRDLAWPANVPRWT